MNSPALSTQDLSKSYAGPHGLPVLGQIDLAIQAQEIVSIVGHSGAGKSTLLRCLAGLETPTSGEVRVNGELITGPPREIALVFQDYSRSLYPWLKLGDNVALPLRSRGVPGDERKRAASAALSAVGLAGLEDRFPSQLSGGMQQRVAIARAIAYEPEILLLDEPFASVDAQTRSELEDLVLEVRERFGMTVVIVTHDVDEAVYMADRVLLLGSSPSSILEDLAVDLPWPRDQITSKETQHFGKLRSHVLSSVQAARPPQHFR